MNSVIELIPEADGAKLARPCYRVYDHGINLDGEKLRPGVWFHGVKRDPEGGEAATNEWLCAPLHVDAVTRSDLKGAEYGRLLRFRNLDDRWLTWAMPSELLAGQPEPILAVLFGMGLDIDYQRRSLLPRYIAVGAVPQ